MNESEMLALAISVAAVQFQNVLDKGGSPYILHCLEVMYRVEHLGKEVMAAAVLHDILEDTSLTVESLYDMGFSTRIIQLVCACTHLDGEDYMDYIKRVSYAKSARAIKLADLRHNMRPDRLIDLSEKSMDRMKKYHTAYQFLLRIEKEDV